MTFTQIYNDDHNFLQGTITIANTATNLAKAYLETIVDGIVDNTAQPILLGFLYQVDASLRRSRPYPIVSQRQTIPLDMSECASFLFVPVSRFIDDYTLSLYVSSESSGATVDLSAYALISQLPDLSTYAKIVDIPNLSNYVSNSQLATALANYALISQLPDLSAYALKTDIPSSFGSSQNFLSISANTTLESGKNYFASSSGLICPLPASPSIGDVINLSTGNYWFRVNHGDDSQSILNLATRSAFGANSGIILKPYSSIQLIYQGSNLWVSGYRSRVVNNWQDTVESDSYPVLQTYTATPFSNSYTYADNEGELNMSRLYDGDTGKGFYTTNTNGNTSVIITFPTEKRLLNFDYWRGFLGSDSLPDRVRIFQGSTKSGTLLKDFTFTSVSGNLALDTIVKSDTYLFEFTRSGTSVAMGELKMYVAGLYGGEIVVS